MKAARTKGPLSLGRGPGNIQGGPLVEYTNGSTRDQIVMVCLSERIGPEEREANTAHIVACWNALEGYEPALVREFLEKATKMIRSSLTGKEWQEISELLARLEGRKP